MENQLKLNGRLELVPIEKIVPYWRNPRNNDDAVGGVEESINAYGLNVPLVLDSEYVIITGHTRYKAAKRNGVTHIECLISNLNHDQAKAYRIIDNESSTKATWELTNLIPEIRELVDFEPFLIHYPELNPDILDGKSIGSTAHAGVSQEDINNTSDALGNKFKDLVDSRQKAIKTYVCPHCGQSFDTNS